MVVDCEICQISIQSERDMLQHLQGKKHLKNLKNAELKDQRKRCSVYVRGFPPSADENKVRKYFSTFGNITKISKKEHFAFLEFSDEKDAQRVIKCRTHNVDGYTMVAKTVNKEKQKQGSSTSKISKSQSKTEKKMKKKKAMAENLKMIETQEDQRNQAILEMLGKAGSIDEQMHMLMETMALTNDDFKQRNDICTMLLEVLKPYFPGSTLHQFGSSVNGFGVKGCDLDLFLDFNDDKMEQTCSLQSEPIHLPYVFDISSLKKSCGPLYAKDLQQMSLFDKVKLVSRILCEKAPGCSDIFCIPSTRCPVVRFVHRPSGMKCDLSVNNRLALRNTQLLALYSKIDERVKLLVYTIRYWSKFHKIAGNENSGPRLTNYALTLLVVYFLQNTSPPVLHSPQTLADLTEKRTVIDGWDCSFIEDLANIPKSENKSSPVQLLANFFNFFAHIEFNAAVLQCRSAKPKLLTDFAKEMSSSAKISNFKFGPLSVQDPFVLEHNVTLNVNEKTKLRILEQFRISSKLCKDWSKKLKKDQSDVNKAWGLMKLFDKGTTCQMDVPDSSKNSQKDDAKFDSSLYHFPIKFKMSMLSESALKQLEAKGDYRYHWCLHVVSFLKKLLSDILLIEVQLDYSSLKSPEEFSLASESFCDEVQEALTESMSETSLTSAPLSEHDPGMSSEEEEFGLKCAPISKQDPEMSLEVEELAPISKSDPQMSLEDEELSLKCAPISKSDPEKELGTICGPLCKRDPEKSSEEELATNCAALCKRDPEKCSEEEEHDSKYLLKQEAGMICDVLRGKRLSSDSLNDADSKRCRTCNDVEDCDMENSIDVDNEITMEKSVDNGGNISESVKSKNGNKSEKIKTTEMEGKEECSGNELNDKITPKKSVDTDGGDKIEGVKSKNENQSEKTKTTEIEVKDDSYGNDLNDKITMVKSVDRVKSKNDKQSEKAKTTEMEGKDDGSGSDFGTLCWICTSECATFNGRKTVRREVVLEGHAENLDLEREVSQRILQKIMPDTSNNNIENTSNDQTLTDIVDSKNLCEMDCASSPVKDKTNARISQVTNASKKSPQKNDNLKAKLAFKCILKPVLASGSTSVHVQFEPVENKKQFSCFYQFLKTFVLKMVDRYLFATSGK